MTNCLWAMFSDECTFRYKIESRFVCTHVHRRYCTPDSCRLFKGNHIVEKDIPLLRRVVTIINSRNRITSNKVVKQKSIIELLNDALEEEKSPDLVSVGFILKND